MKSTDTSGNSHALLWSGTSDSAVDLHPTNLANFISSTAQGVSGGQQVGEGHLVGIAGNIEHALLWNGKPDSTVDLHPTNLTGFSGSLSFGTNGTVQVGKAWTTSPDVGAHALLWNGSADSAVDLHLLLPPGFASSVAYSVDASGDVFGTALDSSGKQHAVEWTPVPEPASLALLAMTALPLAVRRRGSSARRSSSS